jgi:hypothetical protein
MPALGHTVREATIAAEYERLDLADFCRAYLNWWPGEIPADWQVIAEADWLALADPGVGARRPGVLRRRRHPRPLGRRHRRRRGPAGRARPCRGRRPPPRCRVGRRPLGRVGRPLHPCAVVVDDTGPAGSLIAPLEAAGLEVVKPSTRARAAADSGFYDAVTDSQTLRYRPHPALDAAVAGAAKRPLGDAWAWARRGLSTDICPLVAVSLARWGHATRAHLHNREPSIYL